MGRLAVIAFALCSTACPAGRPSTPDVASPPFDRGLAADAMKHAQEGARACDAIEPRVNVHVRVTFLPDGRVSDAVVDHPEVARGSQLASCIEPFFRRAEVPAFRGAPVHLGYSVVRERGSDDAPPLDVAAVRRSMETVDLSSCAQLPGERRGKLYLHLSPRGGHSVAADALTSSTALGGCLVGKLYRSVDVGPFRGPPVELERDYELAPLEHPAERPVRY